MTEELKLDLEYKPTYKPTLFDIHKAFDLIATDIFDGVVGEYQNRMVLFTNWVLGRKNIILVGQRSTAKTNLIDLSSTFCAYAFPVSLASDKADYRDQKRINEASHLIIPEINKTSKVFIEILKDLGEGKKSTYKTLDENKNPIELVINTKPFVTSVADENEDSTLGEELLSRMTVLRTDSSIKLNEDVIQSKLEKAQNPYKKTKVDMDMAEKCKKYVKSLPSIKKYTFIYPMGKSMKSAIPPIFTDSRRDVSKYLDNTYAITLFHKHDRIEFTRNGKQNLIVTPVDVWYNQVIYGDVLIESSLKCSKIEKLILDFLTRTAYENQYNPYVKIKEIHKFLLANGYTPTVSTVEKYCDNLYKNGYLVKGMDGRSSAYEVSAFFKDKHYLMKINWNDVIQESIESLTNYFPEYVDEYKERFCKKENLFVTHPFTGETVNILDYDLIQETNLKNNKDISKKKTIHSFFDMESSPKKEETITQEKIQDSPKEEPQKQLTDDFDSISKSIKVFFSEHGIERNGMIMVDSGMFIEAFGVELTNKLKERSDIMEHVNGFFIDNT